MILYHATPKANLESLREHGNLNPEFSQGKEKVVWLHTASKRHWAILHIQRRHKLPLSEVLVLRVDVPRSKLKRRWRGLWTTAERITQWCVIPAEQMAERPIEDTTNEKALQV